jgi:hypothetical protein
MLLALYNTNTGTVWYDNISVVKDGTTANLVANPGFEVSQDSISVLNPNPDIMWGQRRLFRWKPKARRCGSHATDVRVIV